MNVIVPHLLDTGIAEKLDDGRYEVKLDCAKDVKMLKENQVKTFGWKENRLDEQFLFIVKAWITRFGKVRKLRLQCHKIRADKSWGRRRILREISNGKIVR